MIPTSHHALFVAVVACTALAGACAKPHVVKYGGAVPFTLHNDVEDQVCTVRMTPSETGEWGESWLNEGEAIPTGGERTFMTVGHPSWSTEVMLCNGHVHSGVEFPVTEATTREVSWLPRTTSTVTLVNDTADEVCSLFMAPPNSPWGNNWLGYTVPSGQEVSYIVYKADSWFVRAVSCNGRIYETEVATLEPQRLAVLQQLADVSAVVTLINNLQTDLCAVQLAGTTDADWGYNWLQADTYVPAGNAWTATLRKVDALALRITGCDGRVWEGRGYQGLQDSTIELAWLGLVYEPPPPQPDVSEPSGGYQPGYDAGASSGSQGSSGGDSGYSGGGYASGGDSGTSSGSGASGGSYTGGSSSTYSAPPACAVSDPARCDGDAVLTCQDLGGQVAQHRQVCPMGCKNAACVYAYQRCSPRFAGSGSCPGECDRSYQVSVNGNAYCTSACGPGGECPGGTACTSDGTCLPPCSAPADCPAGFLPYCGTSGFCGRM